MKSKKKTHTQFREDGPIVFRRNYAFVYAVDVSMDGAARLMVRGDNGVQTGVTLAPEEARRLGAILSTP